MTLDVMFEQGEQMLVGALFCGARVVHEISQKQAGCFLSSCFYPPSSASSGETF